MIRKLGANSYAAILWLMLIGIVVGVYRTESSAQVVNPGKAGAKGATGSTGSAGATGPTGPAGVGNSFPMTNNSGTGTIQDKPVIDDGSGHALVAPSGQTAKVLGICHSGCGNTSSATIYSGGIQSCVFENGTTVGNYVIPATGTTGCRDSATSNNWPLLTQGVQTLGVVLSTHVGAGTYDILLFGQGVTTQLGNGVNLSNGTSGLKPGNNDNIEFYVAGARIASWSAKGFYIHPTNSYASPTASRGPLDIDGGQCCNALTTGWPIYLNASSLDQNGNNANSSGAAGGLIDIRGGKGGGFGSAGGSTGGVGGTIFITGGQGGSGRTSPDSVNGNGGDVVLSGGPAGTSGPAGGVTGSVQFMQDTTGSTLWVPGGSNCPASSCTTPYTWLAIKTSDGSKAYVPVFK